MVNSLIIDGKDLCVDFGEPIYCSENGRLAKPQRDIELEHVYGRSGDIQINRKSMSNVEISYNCVVMNNFEEVFDKVCAHLYNLDGYVKIDDNTEDYRLGVFVGPVEIISKLHDAGSFKIVFSCKPQRYLRSGDKALVYFGNALEYSNDDVIDEHMSAIPSASYTTVCGKALAEAYGTSTERYRCIGLYVNDDKGHMYRFTSNIGETVNLKTAYFRDKDINKFIGVVDGVGGKTWLKFTKGVYIVVMVPVNYGHIFYVDDVLMYSSGSNRTGIIKNPTNHTSDPLIKVTMRDGSSTVSAFSISVGGTNITLNESVQGNACIDGATMEIFRDVAGKRISIADKFDFVESVKLLPGKNVISFPPEVQVEIVPRWWRV